jgi:hypothetical protein
MNLPEGYILEKFFSFCKRPVYKRSAGTYNSECPYCHEGKSAGRKRRFFYLPDEEKFYCQNCNRSPRPFQFIRDVTGMSDSEINQEAAEYTTPIADIIKKQERKDDLNKKENKEALPKDSINLFDHRQVAYFKDNVVVQDAMKLIMRRRLDVAINKPRALWISLVDDTHRNRLCFPFYDYGDKYGISYYQTRAMYPSDEIDGRKYISKINSDKTIFNIQNVDQNLDHLFMLEGPIDSMFVKNGVALAGTYLTDVQKDILLRYFPLHKHVYVLDNQWIDKTSWKRTEKMIEEGHNVFIWPKHMSKYKDLNELCCDLQINEVPAKYMLRYVYSKLKAKMVLSEIPMPS